MATISYMTFNFHAPRPLIESDYEILKELLTKNPSYSLNPLSDFIETFKVNLIFLGIGVIGLIILLLDIVEWLTSVGGIIAIIGFFSLFSFLPSLSSYLKFLYSKSSYYSRLKKDIGKSKDFQEFHNLRYQEK